MDCTWKGVHKILERVGTSCSLGAAQYNKCYNGVRVLLKEYYSSGNLKMWLVITRMHVPFYIFIRLQHFTETNNAAEDNHSPLVKSPPKSKQMPSQKPDVPFQNPSQKPDVPSQKQDKPTRPVTMLLPIRKILASHLLGRNKRVVPNR